MGWIDQREQAEGAVSPVQPGKGEQVTRPTRTACILSRVSDDLGRHMIAYAGRRTFDEDASALTHHVDVSVFPNWQGQAHVRQVALEDGFLSIVAVVSELVQDGT